MANKSSKDRSPYYKDKKLAATGFGYENIKGHQFSTKWEANLTSFLIVLWNRTINGWPIVAKKWPNNANAFWPVIILSPKGCTTKTINHEMIHIRQQVELIFVGVLTAVVLTLLRVHVPAYIMALLVFLPYTLYVVELLLKSLWYRSIKKGYYNLSFEREARRNCENANYLFYRKFFKWVKYILW